jgi:hypothetical protein
MKMIFQKTGKMSTFGGPKDTGVRPDEGLALYPNGPDPFTPIGIFLPNSKGLARELDPRSFYCACRWDYKITPKMILRDSIVIIEANGKCCPAFPTDWGPHERTGREIDLSPGVASYLGLNTDNVVTFALWAPERIR